MENHIVAFTLMGSYGLLFAIVWAVFERRLKIIHRHHVEKCQPFAQHGLERIDNRLKIIVRGILAVLLMVSFSTIYFMMT